MDDYILVSVRLTYYINFREVEGEEALPGKGV